MEWFKFYGKEYLSDPKMLALNSGRRSCWVTLLSYACVAEDGGRVKFLDEQQLMMQSGINPNSNEWDYVKGVLQLFEKLEMIKIDSNGTITVQNWNKRQETFLTNAERQKRHREKQKSNGEVTPVLPDSNAREEERRIEKAVAEPTASLSSPSKVPITIVQTDHEGRERPPKKKVDPRVFKLREKLYDLLQEETGHRPTPNVGDYVQLQKALKKLSEDDVMSMFDDVLHGKGVETVRGVFTDRAIDIYEQQNL